LLFLFSLTVTIIMKRLKEIKVAKFSFDYELKVLSKRKNKVIFN